jgi:hypothetical protein
MEMPLQDDDDDDDDKPAEKGKAKKTLEKGGKGAKGAKGAEKVKNRLGQRERRRLAVSLDFQLYYYLSVLLSLNILHAYSHFEVPMQQQQPSSS